MDWRLKCLALHALNYLPYRFHARFKHLTGRYFLTVTDQVLEAYSHHVKNFRGGRALEFGAGSNLLSALLLSEAGADEVLTYDLSRIATVDQVNHVIRQLRAKRSAEWPEITDLTESLWRNYRIRYVAPADARATGLPAASVNFFCSTSTLEHIPPADIRSILLECRRVAAADAVFSFIVDYHDHFTSIDRKIDRVNFYRYSDRVWRLFNPPNHFQNRLRHSDYVALFRECGLEPAEARAIVPHIAIDESRVHARFRHYGRDDLMALNGLFRLHQLGTSTVACQS